MLLTPEFLVVFLPLFGFLAAFLGGKLMGDRAAELVTTVFLFVAAACAAYLFNAVVLQHAPHTVELMRWIEVGSFKANWALRFDTLSVTMLCVVTFVSACVHLYAIGYMHEDESRARFMSYLSLFTFAMLMLVTSDNLVQLFFGWEGVGVASYLLIGFWNYKDSANAAAIKAFLVNRVGDIGLALGVFGAFMLFGTVQFDQMFAQAAGLGTETLNFLGYPVNALTLVCLLLFVGAMGKSAQLGLHTWLPDAMEGPTPVSALIHAATMVTAGVFLVCRMSPVFEYAPDASMVVTYVGALTAIFAATIGMTQFDIKRVIAYSTMSQLGYMFFAAGLGAYGAAMFHLVTHAFFKALLFLGAGSVIHAMHHEQDMRKMGGIWKLIPVTYAFMWVGSLALAGIPPFAGFYSKDAILEVAQVSHTPQGQLALVLGMVAALLTAFYSWRVLLLTFHGKPRADHHTMEHVHESPAVMIVPLVILGIGAVLSGIMLKDYFVGEHAAAFWGNALFFLPETLEKLHHAHALPEMVKLQPLFVALTGIALSYLAYLFIPGIPARVVSAFKPVHTLFFNKWFVDELYTTLFVKPAQALGRVFFKTGDGTVINGFGPDGAARVSVGFAAWFSKLQSGFLYHYAFIMIAALVVYIAYTIMHLQGVF